MKIIIKIFICFSLIYTPFFAFAGAAEKWEIVEKVYDSSSKTVEVTARKVGATAANDPFYKARVPVAASELGSAARSGIVGLALFAGVSAMLAGIGWVMEDGGRVFKREIPSDPAVPDQCGSDGSNCPNVPQLYTIPERYFSNNQQIYYSTPEAVGTYYCPKFSWPGSVLDHISGAAISCRAPNGDIGTAYILISVANPSYSSSVPPAPKQYEILSDTQLGEEILGEGENTAPLPDVITDIYDPNSPIPDSAPKQKTADALDSANPQPGTEPDGSTAPKPNSDSNGDGTPDTYDPAKPDAGSKFTLPNFCAWAPAVCDFFKVQKQDNKEIKENQKTDMAQNQSFFDEVKDWFTWSKENDDLPDDEKPQISEIPTPELKEDAIRWSAQCPADAQVPINMQGVSSTITFSWSPWCQLLDMIKPAIIASAYIGAAFIVLGLRT